MSGHRIGTAEVEGVIGQANGVAEAAVVGFPHEIKGEAMYAYVTLTTGKSESNDVTNHIKNSVRKIMRRILRKIAEGDVSNLGDTSTLADPTAVESLVEGRK